MYIAWLGDSRAYSYRPGEGIGRLSKDHSYVQQLVDKGILTDEEAMRHPQSNIITRSLGDTSKRAKAEVIEHDDLKDGEIIMLCSDGLCGVCPDDKIGSLLMEPEHGRSLQECKDMLTNMALNAGGSDNITIALMQIFKSKETDNAKLRHQEKAKKKKNGHDGLIMSVVSIITLLMLIGCFVFFGINSCKKEKPAQKPSSTIDTNNIQQYDTTKRDETSDTSSYHSFKDMNKGFNGIKDTTGNGNDSTITGSEESKITSSGGKGQPSMDRLY